MLRQERIWIPSEYLDAMRAIVASSVIWWLRVSAVANLDDGSFRVIFGVLVVFHVASIPFSFPPVKRECGRLSMRPIRPKGKIPYIPDR
jgi:hypothetical protein